MQANDQAMLARVVAGVGDGSLRAQQQQRYGDSLAGLEVSNPSLRILRATLEHWQRGRIPVLAVIIPIDVDRFATLGLANPEGIARTSESVAKIARETGAEFVDIHDLLPSSAFVDVRGHFDYASEIDGPVKMAERVAPKLAAMVSADR